MSVFFFQFPTFSAGISFYSYHAPEVMSKSVPFFPLSQAYDAVVTSSGWKKKTGKRTRWHPLCTVSFDIEIHTTHAYFGIEFRSLVAIFRQMLLLLSKAVPRRKIYSENNIVFRSRKAFLLQPKKHNIEFGFVMPAGIVIHIVFLLPGEKRKLSNIRFNPINRV